MQKRPIAVTIIALIFIAAGVIGIVYHAPELNIRRPFESDVVLALIVRLLAIVCGAYMLRGSNWARWVAVLWMAYHVALSWFHSFGELAMHALLLAVIAYFLFRGREARYFCPPAIGPV
jgi:hypothetical protein